MFRSMTEPGAAARPKKINAPAIVLTVVGGLMLLIGLFGAPAARRAAEDEADSDTLSNAVMSDALGVRGFETVEPDLTMVWVLYGVAGFGVLAILLGLLAFAIRRS